MKTCVHASQELNSENPYPIVPTRTARLQEIIRYSTMPLVNSETASNINAKRLLLTRHIPGAVLVL